MGKSNIVLTFDGDGAVTHRYLHGPGVEQLFADESAVDGLLWALADRQGSVRDWAQRDAGTGATAVYDHVEFDACGTVESQTNASHRATVGYTGLWRDPLTGLQRKLHRWYDPASGGSSRKTRSGSPADRSIRPPTSATAPRTTPTRAGWKGFLHGIRI